MRFYKILLIAFLPFQSLGQSIDSLQVKLDSLSSLFKQIREETSYSKRDSLNNIFYSGFKNLLKHQETFEFSFDSIRFGKLKSPDGALKVYTWNIPQPAGYQKYYGFMQYKLPSGKVKLIELKDSRKEIKDPRNEQLDASKWMAALYYQLIQFSRGNKNVYILLGFDYNNLFTSKKIIEVVTFDNNGNPLFGLPVFNVDGKYHLSRIVFEFNARVSMVLRYIEDSKVIVFDHLSPSSSEFIGDLQYYGPDGSFDGFKLENSEWVYVRDLDLRNPRRERPKPVDAPVDIKEPGFLYKSNLFGK
jgi:hypothetical protein